MPSVLFSAKTVETFYENNQTFLVQGATIAYGIFHNTPCCAYYLRYTIHESWHCQMGCLQRGDREFPRPFGHGKHPLILACHIRRGCLQFRIHSGRVVQAMPYSHDFHHVCGTVCHTRRRPARHKRAGTDVPDNFCTYVLQWPGTFFH